MANHETTTTPAQEHEARELVIQQLQRLLDTLRAGSELHAFRLTEDIGIGAHTTRLDITYGPPAFFREQPHA